MVDRLISLIFWLVFLYFVAKLSIAVADKY
jgi:hypothetical protein